MARVLVMTAPFTGHTNPTLPLVGELARQGHDVHYINAPKWQRRIEDLGAKFIRYLNYPENLSQTKELRRFFQAAYSTALSLQERYDILIYDSFFYLGKTLGDKLGIPCIRLMFTPALNNHAIEEGRKDVKTRRMSNRMTITYYILDKLVLNNKAKRQMDVGKKNLSSAVLNDIAELNIVFVAESFQPYRDTFDERFVFTIPGIKDTRQAEIEIPYEKMKRPIIYISLGSMIRDKGFLKKCLKAFGHKDLTVILSCGGLQPDKLGNLPDNIYAYSFVPQLEVLQHVDLFLTHGGMNSVNEAIFYGVPMLVRPITCDQPINALQVEKLRIGKELTGRCSAKEISMQTMDILNDAAIKRNAEVFKRKVRADIGVAGVVDKIEKVLQSSTLKDA